MVAEGGQIPAEIKAHFAQCADNCESRYRELLELTLAEASGEIPPPPGGTPKFDLSFLPPPSDEGLNRHRGGNLAIMEIATSV